MLSNLAFLKIEKLIFFERKIFFTEEFNVLSIEDLKNVSFFLSAIIFKNSFLALSGEIGVGKTTLVRLLSSYMGIKENISSPTFNIVKSYWIERERCFLNHFDFFKFLSEDDSLPFEEIKEGNINIAEWADVSPSFWINEKLLIYLKIVDVSDFKKVVYVTFFK